MDSLAFDIVYHLAELQYEHDLYTGQRWPVTLPQAKQNVLAFRSVCRSFRDACWISFRDILAERIFYLNEADLTILSDIACHHRLGPLISTLTLGSQVFTPHGLRILESGLVSHPVHAGQHHLSSPAWQRGLSSRSNLDYTELVRFKELYKEELDRQEGFWFTGGADLALSECLHRLPNIRSIRIYPRPCHVTFQVQPGKDGNLSFASRSNRHHHFVPHGAVNHMRCNGWRNIDRTLVALGKLCAGKLAIEELCSSSASNVRWSLRSVVFNNEALFSNLRTLRLSIREEALAADEEYVEQSSLEAAHTFTKCLMAAKHLRLLDLEICSVDENYFNSYVLAYISREEVPFRLEQLVLEYNCQSETTLAKLVQPHATTLKRLVLLNSWLTHGTWNNWLRTMTEFELNLDFLEAWKPCQESMEHFRHQVDWFPLSLTGAVAKGGKIVPFLPQEQWGNCYPRYGLR